MALKLTIISQQANSGIEPVKAVDHRGITIGRAPDNDWVLPDPDRHLSKRHCEIAFEDGGYVLTDTSTNGVYLNGAAEPIGRGNRSRLRDGDRLSLGDYRIEVTITQDVPAADATMAAAREPDPFAELIAKEIGGADDLDPFGIDRDAASRDSWLGEPDGPSASSGPPPGSSFTDRPASDAAGPSGPLLPDDDDLFGSGDGGNDWGAGSYPDHVPSEQEFFRPPAVTRNLIPEDWDAEDGADDLLGPLDEAPPRGAPEPFDPSDPLGPAEPLGSIAPQGRPEPAPSPTRPASAFAQSDPVRAFLAGAGLENAGIAEAEAAELMHAAGRTFREMVQGLREILMARASIKNEFRIERTVIRSAGNNPLKFSVSVDEALLAMLRPAGPGYLSPIDAVQEGFKDLKAHQLAVMAGMQVALTALLERFDPEGLKQRLTKGSVLDGILPGARKARYWELYEAFYREIASEAEQDFQGVFGRAFARAYEEQVKKL